MIPTLAGRIRLLDGDARPAVVRFDGGPAFAGRIAVLPAAYNPPTLAHLHLLELAEREPDISGSAALLSTRNVDKVLHGATLEQRIRMLLLVHESDGVSVLATNQARLADQSNALARSFPGIEFDFVVGYDTLVRLFDDRYYDDMAAELAPFFARQRVIATNRSEHSLAEVRRFVESHPVAREHRHRIMLREIAEKPASYSSSASREHAAAGDPALSQVPPAVAEYIRSHGLYREP